MCPSIRGSCSRTCRRGPSRHPDRLDVDELLEPVLRQLASVPRALDSPEREPGIGSHEAVHEHATDLELPGEPLANASRYGLGASVWSADPARGERLARELEVG